MATKAEIKWLKESNAIERIYDEQSLEDAIDAWEYLKQFGALTLGAIMETHAILMINQPLAEKYQGEFRTCGVMVGGRICPSPELVPHLMANWVLDMKDPYQFDPIDMHVRYEKIHPHADGNGRLGRLLLRWHEEKICRTPTVFKDKEKHKKYYPLFR